MRSALLLATVACVACAPRVPQLTKAEHRAEALRHEQKGAEEEAKFDPGQAVRTPPPARTPFAEPGTEFAQPGGEWVEFNPTQQHLERADAEFREAAAHARAAQALAAFEDDACKTIPAAERASCPLLASQVSAVQQTKSGVRLLVRKGANAAEISRRLNCHLAFAIANGFDQPSCPLFVKGMVIQQLKEGVIAMTAPTPEVVAQLHSQARRVFSAGKAPSELPLSTR